jgi:hypothetical protein
MHRLSRAVCWGVDVCGVCVARSEKEDGITQGLEWMLISLRGKEREIKGGQREGPGGLEQEAG